MSEERHDDESIITLVDKDGNVLIFDTFRVGGRRYATMLPEETFDGTPRKPIATPIFQIVQDQDGKDILAEIEDGEELRRVAVAWDEFLQQRDRDEDELAYEASFFERADEGEADED